MSAAPPSRGSSRLYWAAIGKSIEWNARDGSTAPDRNRPSPSLQLLGSRSATWKTKVHAQA